MASKAIKQRAGKYGSHGGNGGYMYRKPMKDTPNPSKSKKPYINYRGNDAAPRASRGK